MISEGEKQLILKHDPSQFVSRSRPLPDASVLKHRCVCMCVSNFTGSEGQLLSSDLISEDYLICVCVHLY